MEPTSLLSNEAYTDAIKYLRIGEIHQALKFIVTDISTYISSSEFPIYSQVLKMGSTERRALLASAVRQVSNELLRAADKVEKG